MTTLNHRSIDVTDAFDLVRDMRAAQKQAAEKPRDMSRRATAAALEWQVDKWLARHQADEPPATGPRLAPGA